MATVVINLGLSPRREPRTAEPRRAAATNRAHDVTIQQQQVGARSGGGWRRQRAGRRARRRAASPAPASLALVRPLLRHRLRENAGSCVSGASGRLSLFVSGITTAFQRTPQICKQRTDANSTAYNVEVPIRTKSDHIF